MFGKSVLIYVDQVYIVFGKIAQKFAFEIRIENVSFLSSRSWTRRLWSAGGASRKPRVAVRRGSVLPDPSRWEIRVGTPSRS